MLLVNADMQEVSRDDGIPNRKVLENDCFVVPYIDDNQRWNARLAISVLPVEPVEIVNDFPGVRNMRQPPLECVKSIFETRKVSGFPIYDFTDYRIFNYSSHHGYSATASCWADES